MANKWTDKYNPFEPSWKVKATGTTPGYVSICEVEIGRYIGKHLNASTEEIEAEYRKCIERNRPHNPKQHNIPYRGTPLITEPPIFDRSRMLVNPTNQRRTSVCTYLKNKIASEEKESEEYRRLAEDAGELDAGKFGYIPFLIEVQQKEVKLLRDVYKRVCGEPNTGKYAIYYYKGVDYFPAAGVYVPKDVYNSREEAISVARELSGKHHGVVFGVYPVNHNFEISGKAVASYGSL